MGRAVLCWQTAAAWAGWLVVALVALVLALFLLVQLLWTWRTEGAKATLVIAHPCVRACTCARLHVVRQLACSSVEAASPAALSPAAPSDSPPAPCPGAQILLVTSFVIFPPLALLEFVENIFFPPGKQRRQSPGTHAAGSPLHLPPGAMCALDGIVTHRRTEQAYNAFAYRVRYFLVPLDSPPATFQGDHLTADEAREYAGTTGPVLLLTVPSSAGYHQNPISVYYCYSAQGALAMCIAEVTNTPWGERVRFLFHPQQDVVPKSLHVSPFLDMNRCWHLEASDPCEKVLPSRKNGAKAAHSFRVSPSLVLSVTCLPNCEAGSPFFAVMKVHPTTISVAPSGWSRLSAYLMPHRVALRIYWQALILVLKGVRYCPHPNEYDGASYETLVSRPGCACPHIPLPCTLAPLRLPAFA
jgi:DUF1365 family protein